MIYTVANAQTVNSIYYRVFYDPMENAGLLEVRITISAVNTAWFYIPLQVFGEGVVFEYLGYNYTSELKPLGVNYDEAEYLVEVQAQGMGDLLLYFNISNLLEQTGLTDYTLYLDTTELKYLTRNTTVEITLPGIFEQETIRIRGEVEVSTIKSTNITQLLIKGFGELISTLYMQFEEVTTTQTSQRVSWIPVLIIVAIAVALAMFLLIYYFTRRKPGIVVEHIDYTRDQASILIIKALRNSGIKGLTQAEISKVTGLPKSSVSRRIRRLEEEGFVEVKRVGKYNYVFLTNKGLELAKKILGGRNE
jgi:Uncharacterized membrane-associated protein/domain